MSVRTGSSVLPCRKRCKYSCPVSKEPSDFCVENNSSFVDAERRTTDTEHNTGSKNDSCTRLNESEIQETLQEIKSEVCNSNFMLSNAMNGLKENEILKTLWEMKADHCNFQREVLTRLLSIETEINNLKNVLCLSKLPKTNIRITRTGSAESHVETEKNTSEKSVCLCKHPEIQTAEGKTKPSVIYLEPPCVTEINNIDNALCSCKHPEKQIVRGSTKPSITETPSETEINNIDNSLCIHKHPETHIVRGSTKPSITETPSEIEINNIHNSLCVCKHYETQIVREITQQSIIEPSIESEINHSENSLCMYRHSETSIANDVVKPNAQNPPAETDEIDIKNVLPIYRHPWASIASVTTRLGLPKLPIDSTESLQSVEEWLEDKDNVQILTHHFSTIGGDHVKDTTKRILSRSFTQNIAVNINWTGKNNKYPLSKGCLAKVIIAAVKLTHKYENITEKRVEEFIKAWFRFAKDRDGGRERRRSANNSLIKG